LSKEQTTNPNLTHYQGGSWRRVGEFRGHNLEPELWMASLIQLGDAYVYMF
jgi:hypothetical protein